MNFLSRFTDPVYCVMRLIVGLVYACHGGQKLLGFPGGGHGAQGLMLVGGIVELVGGFLIAFGLFTRLAAFVSSGEMAVAYFMVHAAGKALAHAGTAPIEQFFPILNKGELAVVLCWIFFFMVFYGPGRWSIDAMLFRRKTPATTPSTI